MPVENTLGESGEVAVHVAARVRQWELLNRPRYFSIEAPSPPPPLPSTLLAQEGHGGCSTKNPRGVEAANRVERGG